MSDYVSTPGIRMLVESLSASFTRVDNGVRLLDAQDKRKTVVISMLGYAQLYAEHSLAGALLNRSLREDYDALLERNKFWEQRVAPVYRSVANVLVSEWREWFDGLDNPTPAQQDETQKAIGQLNSDIDSGASLPGKTQQLVRLLEVFRQLGGTSTLSRDRGELKRLGELEQMAQAEERKFGVLQRKRGVGARLVCIFRDAHERQDIRSARGDFPVINQINRTMGLEPIFPAEHANDWGDFAKSDAELVACVAVFHDWVIRELMKTSTIESVLYRYRDRVQRFESVEYRSQIDNEDRAGDEDETECKKRLGVYLHDSGFDPWLEVKDGETRADVVARDSATGVPRVALEAKCVRKYDDAPTIKKRLQSEGCNQAQTYAAHFQQQVAFLVVYWTSTTYFLECDPRWEQLAIPLRIIVVDVSGSPHKSRGRELIRLSPKLVDPST